MKKRARRKPRLEAWLGETAAPLFLLDAKRRLLFFNHGCRQLTGWSADDVVGLVCDYATEPDQRTVEAVTVCCCPPPEVFLGRPASVPVYLPHRDGHTTARLLNFYPLPDADGRVQSVLGVICELATPAPRTSATAAQQLHAELAALRHRLRQRYGETSLIGSSPVMLRVFDQIALAGESTAPVLLTGESGAGKEHVARTIHYRSRVGRSSFTPYDCRRLSAFELKRALRRALESFEGDGPPPALLPGTLYFQHVDAMPRDVQERLVDAFRDDGSHGMRLMAASTVPLEPLLLDERFRADLFYLLTTIHVELPPLRERPEDLRPLAQHLLERLNRDREKQVAGFSDEVWNQFRRYNWPGNVDELTAVVAEARDACAGELIAEGDLPFRFRTGADAQRLGPAVRPRPRPLEPLLAEVEREQIERALAECRQNKSKAAELLGITRARLHRRIQALGIEAGEDDAAKATS